VPAQRPPISAHAPAGGPPAGGQARPKKQFIGPAPPPRVIGPAPGPPGPVLEHAEGPEVGVQLPLALLGAQTKGRLSEAETAELISRVLAERGGAHAVLGVPAGAPRSAVQKAFLRAARATHPDKCDLPGARPAFERVNAAKDALCDPEERAKLEEALGDQKLWAMAVAEAERQLERAQWGAARAGRPIAEAAPPGVALTAPAREEWMTNPAIARRAAAPPPQQRNVTAFSQNAPAGPPRGGARLGAQNMEESGATAQAPIDDRRGKSLLEKHRERMQGGARRGGGGGGRRGGGNAAVAELLKSGGLGSKFH